MTYKIKDKRKSYLRKLGLGATVLLNVLAMNNADAQTVQNSFPTSGNVGIGTTTPYYALHIKHSTPLVYLQNTNNSYYSMMYNDYAGNLRFHNSHGFFILGQSGNLGIGTGTPEARLHVNSTAGTGAIISSNTNGASLELRGLGVNSMPTLTLSNTNKSLYSTTFMDLDGYLRTSNVGGFSIFTKSGDLGLGTLIPASRLHVYDTNKDAVLRLQSAPRSGFGSSGLEFWSDPRGAVNEWRPAGIKSFDKGGFVGGLTFYTNGQRSGEKTNTVDAMKISEGKVFADKVVVGDMNEGDDNKLDISSENHSLFVKRGILTERLDADKVVIGDMHEGDENKLDITSENYSLFVKRGILTERLKVSVANTTNWADYVFDKNYKLSKLSEVENYIQKNKHLPGIPSSDEMVANGMDVLQMNAKLLEKIEELTLYTIELNKKYEALEKKVNEGSK